ncbi:MAG TPA: DUF503 domain-containing protein [Candidatus Eisenbacteria bacterium]|nr:DUF503 domain-containing protein [Candidatus Eisenbacteria bacterium]
MLIGTLRLEIHLPAADSLKAKRSVVNHVKERVRHRFNAAIAEVGHQELWQRTTLGVAVVGEEAPVLDRALHEILAVIEREDRLAVLDYAIEIS